MKRIKEYISKLDKKIILIVFILIVLTMAPLLFQGIICNDELQTRFLRKQGMLNLIKDNIENARAKGRTIGGYVDVRAFSFLTNNMYINRLIDILLILMVIGLFMYFIYCINGNKRFSYFVGVTLLVCLPVTFEHGAPNAFVAITVIPAMLVIVSFILYWKYLQSEKKRYLIFAMVPYLIGMMQYEFIVTYVLVFYVLIFRYGCKKGKINWGVSIRKAVVPTIATVLYIIAYFLMQQLNASNYAGNTIGFTSLKSSLKVLYVLGKSSIPGYFLFNDKYKYLKDYCMSQFEYKEFLSVLLFLIGVLVVSVIVVIFNHNGEKKGKWNWMEMAVAAAYMVIPALPNSISSMYQGNVTETFFTWLPVSIFLYFAAGFLICSIIWNILKGMNKYMLVLGAVCIACFVGAIQSMNYVVANQQHKDFVRLENIENMFGMQLWTNFDGVEIHSEDIYETRNLLAVHDFFWTQYLHNNGVNINVTREETGNLNLYFVRDEYFVLTNGLTAIVVSPKSLKGYQAVRVSNDQYVCGEFKEEAIDSDYFIYSFIVDGLEADAVSLDKAIAALHSGQCN